MKHFQTLLPLFAAAAVAQNQFPDPLFEPDGLGNKIPIDGFTPAVRPIADGIVNINSSVVALDVALIGFTGADQIDSTLGAANTVLQTITDTNAAISAIPVIPSDDNDEASVIDLIPYANSLSYHVNHTVVNLVLKKDLAVGLCQGPTVLQAIIAQQSAASSFVDTVTSKVPAELQGQVPAIVGPILVALSSASSAFADQTTTTADCTPTTSTTTTGTATSSSTSVTSTSTSSGSSTGPSGTWEGWYTTASHTTASHTSTSYTTLCTTTTTPAGHGSSYPTGTITSSAAWATWSATKSSTSPSTTSLIIKPYKGAAVVNNAGPYGAAALAALAAAAML